MFGCGYSALRSRLNQLDARSGSWRAFVKIDPTNFGERYDKDAYGRVIDATPRVVVLHETVYSLSSALNTFMTPHPRDEDQVSYHTLVGQDGRVLDLVDPLSRAYGAGFSAFLGEWAITNKKLKGSVNNFASASELGDTTIRRECQPLPCVGYTSQAIRRAGPGVVGLDPFLQSAASGDHHPSPCGSGRRTG